MDSVAKNPLLLLALAISLPVLCGGCASTTVNPSQQQQSFVGKLSSSVKSGTSKMVAAVSPKQQTLPAPVASPNGKPGPNVFVAVARMHESTGRFDEAEANYRKALELKPYHLDALIGYARLEDRRSNFEAATRLYQKAMRKYPKEASVHNDLGLCYHRRGRLPEATRELKRAVDLEDDNKLYRNNLAAVYVEQGKNDDALAQLTAAHGQSVGHYNLAYLLMQKQDRAGALHHFQMAAQQDRNLVAAHQWVAKLSGTNGPYASPAGGTAVAAGPQPADYPAAQPQSGPTPYVAQRVGSQPSYAPQYAPPSGGAYAPQYGPTQTGAQQPAPAGASDPVPPLPNRY
jgi:tetratricopeptide (TPR) repeat protein